jgi:hypothetical protein
MTPRDAGDDPLVLYPVTLRLNDAASGTGTAIP